MKANKRQCYVARIAKGGFLKFTEHEYDMTGYGGSTGSTFNFRKVGTVAQATLCDTLLDFPPMPTKTYGSIIMEKVEVTTTYKIV